MRITLLTKTQKQYETEQLPCQICRPTAQQMQPQVTEAPPPPLLPSPQKRRGRGGGGGELWDCMTSPNFEDAFVNCVFGFSRFFSFSVLHAGAVIFVIINFLTVLFSSAVLCYIIVSHRMFYWSPSMLYVQNGFTVSV